ncbi:MAG: MFS transporter [Verrucomicrobiota bacterium]
MKSSTSKGFICGLLFLATLLNYLDRQTMSVSASKIAEEMRLTDGHLGQLFFAFLFAYGIAQILVGPVLDRLGVVLAYAIAVTAWSLAGASSALTAGFTTLFAARLLLGVCESPNWPLALRVVSRVFPPSHRCFAISIFQSGTSVGALIAPPIIIYLTTAYNWRISFVAVGALGLIWSSLWLAWFRWQPERALDDVAPAEALSAAARLVSGSGAGRALAATTEERTDALPGTFAEIIRTRAFWGLVIATSFLNPLQYLYTTWLPRYFDKYAGVGFGKELAHRLVIVYLALDLGLWSGGALVALLSRHMQVRRARTLVTTVGALCMMSIPIVSKLHSLDAITGNICLATFGLGWFIVNYLAFTAEVSAKKVSTAAGLLGGTGSLAGAGFMLLVGGTVERTGSFELVFLMAGLMPLVALGGLWLSTKPAPQALGTSAAGLPAKPRAP